MIECNIILLRQFHQLAVEILSDFCNSPLVDSQTHSRHDQPVQWIAQTFGSSELKTRLIRPAHRRPRSIIMYSNLALAWLKIDFWPLSVRFVSVEVPGPMCIPPYLPKKSQRSIRLKDDVAMPYLHGSLCPPE